MSNTNTNIKIDQQMLIDELYNLRKYISVDNDDAQKQLMKIVDLVLKAPLVDSTARFPRTRGIRNV